MAVSCGQTSYRKPEQQRVFRANWLARPVAAPFPCARGRSLDRPALHPHAFARLARGLAGHPRRQRRRRRRCRCRRHCHGGGCHHSGGDDGRGHRPCTRRCQLRRVGSRLGLRLRPGLRSCHRLLHRFDRRRRALRRNDNRRSRLGRRTPGRPRAQPREGLHSRPSDRLGSRHRLHAAGKRKAENANGCAVRDRQHLRRSCCGLIASPSMVPVLPQSSQPLAALGAMERAGRTAWPRRANNDLMTRGGAPAVHISFARKWIPDGAPMV